MKQYRFWLCAIALALLASGLTFVITLTQTTRAAEAAYAPYVEYYETHEALEGYKDNYYGVAEKIKEVGSYVDHFYIGEYDLQAVSDAAAAGLVEGVGDRWSHYMSADEVESYYENVNSTYVGIGVTVTFVENEGLHIEDVTPNSPAYHAGVEIGEMIVAVEGDSTAELGLDESRDRIRGEEGTSVTITIESSGNRRDVTITRRVIETQNVKYSMLGDDVGYIQILDFNQYSARQTIDAIRAVGKLGAEKLLFDVRFNPGGYKSELCELLDFLLPEGVIFQSVDYQGNEEIIRSDAMYLDMPMAVLVNEDSYSAAEFFAAALQEYDAATVIGHRTTGKGYFQQTFVLSDGSAVTISTGRYTTPNGVSLVETEGMTPDVEVDLDDEDYMALYYGELAPEDDEQLQAALKALKEFANRAG